MKTSCLRFTLPFSRILAGKKYFVLETAEGRFRLTTNIGEYYILLNLSAGSKLPGHMVIETGEEKGKPVLRPVALIHGDRIIRVMVTGNERTDYAFPVDMSILTPFLTHRGETYADGFIDASCTFLTYKELSRQEEFLRRMSGGDTGTFYQKYNREYPGMPYDVRLHYPMIRNIRKHPYHADDFLLAWVHPSTFYYGWTQPAPCYLFQTTYKGNESWPSYLRMRLMAENRYREAIPLALKVLNDTKANERILHYAIVIAGLDEANDPLILTFADRCPRALLRVYGHRRADTIYPLLLRNARQIEAGSEEDLLDDVNRTQKDPYRDYTIAQRGYVKLEALSEAQIGELGESYLRIAARLTKPLPEKEFHRLGNALRSFLIALSFNSTPAANRFICTIYNEYNNLLYSVLGQDSALSHIDGYWAQYLQGFATVNGWESDFLEKLSAYAENADRTYSEQRFFLVLYARLAYQFLAPEEFYEKFSRRIEDEFSDLGPIWSGVTSGEQLPDDSPMLDHCWRHMFEDFYYDDWQDNASHIYTLVEHRIMPHPEGWTIKDWYRKQYGDEEWFDEEEAEDYSVEKNFFPVAPEEGGKDDFADSRELPPAGINRIKAGESIGEIVQSFYEDPEFWLIVQVSRDTTGILSLLFQRMEEKNAYRIFPDQTDRFIAEKSGKEIKQVNRVMEELLQRVRQAFAGKTSYYSRSFSAFCHELVRHYLIAVSRQPSSDAAWFMDKIYNEYHELLYDCKPDEINPQQIHYWMNYLTGYVERKKLLPGFFARLQDYFKRKHREAYLKYDYFYISLYGKLAIRVWDPGLFYDNLHQYVENDFIFLEAFFKGILSDSRMQDQGVMLDVRWRDTFNRWKRIGDFDKAFRVFEWVKDFFPAGVPREAEIFFTHYPE